MNWTVFGIVAGVDLVVLRLPFLVLGWTRAFWPDAQYLPFLNKNVLALSIGLFALAVLITSCACFRRTREVAAAFAAAGIAGSIFVSPRLTIGYMITGCVALGLATIMIWFVSRIGLSVMYYFPMKRKVEQTPGGDSGTRAEDGTASGAPHG